MKCISKFEHHLTVRPSLLNLGAIAGVTTNVYDFWNIKTNRIFIFDEELLHFKSIESIEYVSKQIISK